MTDRVDINDWVAPESNSTQNGFEFRKRVPVTTIPRVLTSFLLITYACPTAVGLGDGAPWRGGAPWRCGAKGLAAPFSTAFILLGHAAIRCSGLPHHMHLLVPTRPSGVVWFVPLHFAQGGVEPAWQLLGGVGVGFFWFTLSLGVPRSNPFLFWLIRFRALNSVFTHSTSAAHSYSSWYVKIGYPTNWSQI